LGKVLLAVGVVVAAGVVLSLSSSLLPLVSVPASLLPEPLSELESAFEPEPDAGDDAADPDPEVLEAPEAGELDVVSAGALAVTVTVVAVATGGWRSAASAVSCAAVWPLPFVMITIVANTDTAASTANENRLRRMSSSERIRCLR
jgi:hypothetical protein